MIQFKKCPRCQSDLLQDEDTRYCAKCGYDLLEAARVLKDIVVVEPPKIEPQKTVATSSNDLPRPLHSFWYIVIGLGGLVALSIGPLAIVLVAEWSGAFSSNGLIWMGFIISVASYLAILYFPVKGWYGRFNFLGFCNLVAISAIPFANFVVIYYLGKGIYMASSKQTLSILPTPSKVGLVIVVILIAVGIVISALSSTPPAPTSYSTPIPTYRPIPTATPYVPRNTAAPSCYRWSQINVSMSGRTVCVYGVITNLIQDNTTVTRYEFTFAPNTFFLYSKNYFFYDPITGKTLTTGDCVSAIGTIQVIANVPYMDITNTKGSFSHNPADCQ